MNKPLTNASDKVIVVIIVPVAVVIFVAVFNEVPNWIYLTDLMLEVNGLPYEGKEYPRLIYNDGTLAVISDGPGSLDTTSLLLKGGYTIAAISNEGEYTYTYMTKVGNLTKQ